MDKLRDYNFNTLKMTSVILTIYTLLAYLVALTGISGDMWTSANPGSLFPIPYPSSTSLIPINTKMSLIDNLIYTYLIKTGFLLFATAIMWLFIIKKQRSNGEE